MMMMRRAAARGVTRTAAGGGGTTVAYLEMNNRHEMNTRCLYIECFAMDIKLFNI